MVLFGLWLILSMSSSAQDRSQARSMVISRDGIVAASQSLAAQAGAQVLARGGPAIDADHRGSDFINLRSNLSERTGSVGVVFE